jgi:hypothetical protein
MGWALLDGKLFDCKLLDGKLFDCKPLDVKIFDSKLEGCPLLFSDSMKDDGKGLWHMH